jgi:hypothetical protein
MTTKADPTGDDAQMWVKCGTIAAGLSLLAPLYYQVPGCAIRIRDLTIAVKNGISLC